MKTIQGAFLRAFLNKSFTFIGPIAINMLSKSVAFAGIKFTFDSPARAFAKSVFPFPGAPSKRSPLGNRIPFFAYSAGFCIILTICVMSFLIFSMPTIFSNFTPVLCTTLKVFGLINFRKAIMIIPKKNK